MIVTLFIGTVCPRVAVLLLFIIRILIAFAPVFGIPVLLVLHPLPEAVVIQGKGSRKLQLFHVVSLPFQKVLVDPLGGEYMDLLLQAVVHTLAEFRCQFCHRAIVHGINDGSDRNITGKIPELPVLFFSCRKHMAEHAVQDHMQIGAVQPTGTIHIQTKQMVGIKTDIRRVCTDRRRGKIHDESEAVESRPQKAHREIQIRPRCIQYSFSHLIELHAISHRSAPLSSAVLCIH